MNNLRWNDSLVQDPSTVIEFVTVPNNPSGELRKPIYPTAAQIYDMVYYWPSLTAITYRAAHPIMMFSMSKLTGHAGTRLGWAWVKDPVVASLMSSFVSTVEIHPSIDVRELFLPSSFLLLVPSNKHKCCVMSYIVPSTCINIITLSGAFQR
jgi:hypothetical protein